MIERGQTETTNLRVCAGEAASLEALLTAASGARAPANDADVAEVVVTGSRAVRNGSTAPTAVIVVPAEQLQTAPPVSIADTSNQLPAFKGSRRDPR